MDGGGARRNVKTCGMRGGRGGISGISERDGSMSGGDGYREGIVKIKKKKCDGAVLPGRNKKTTI